jgi:DNA polymerase I-like protein with 3'-5' exonuclease and polymerase domains
MGPGSLYDQLNGNGYKISLEDCRKLFQKYMTTFQTTIGWLKAQQRHASTHFKMSNINGRARHWYKPDPKKIESNIREELQKKGTVGSYSELQIKDLVAAKRKAQLAAIEREGANFQIQSVNADFTKVAMHRCRKEFKKRGWGPNTPKGSRTYNSVYDEVVYDFHKDFAEEGFALQQEIMKGAANEMLRQVPMDVEGHLEPKWKK